MYYTVTFNPSLDYIIFVDDFEYASLNRSKEEYLVPGGKGINVSIVLKNLGKDTKAFAFTAGYTGDMLKPMVADKGVELISIPVNNGQTRINVKLKSGKETEINGKGPSITEADLNKLYLMIEEKLTKDDYLILSGNVSASLSKDVYRDLIEIANKVNAKCIVDAEGELLTRSLPLKPFLIKPNKEELAMIFKTEIKSNEDVIKYARKLKEMGAKNVLVSLGKDGAILIADDNKTYVHKAPNGMVKNSVGAGDSMVAGFLSSYEESNDYHLALLHGIAAGSATAFSGTLTTKDKQREQLKELKKHNEECNFRS